MAKVTAFIARSFHEADNKRLRPILEFLNTFQKAGFFCISAEPAEVESVSEKVRRIIGECEVLIGFFTRKHPVYDLGTSLLDRLAILPGIRPTLWTAPAWVLQESGFALGHEKDVILLREEGVEIPGLQGDLEYVPFDPDNPSTVYGKLSSMINDLLAKADGRKIEISVTTLTKEPPVEASVAASQQENGEAKAKETSKAEIFELFDTMLLASHEKEFSKLYEAYQNGLTSISEAKAGKVDKVLWTSLYFGLRYKAGASDGLDALKKLKAEHPDRGEPARELADQLFELKEYKEAARLYVEASSHFSADEKLSSLSKACEANIEAQDYEGAIDIARTIIKSATGNIRTEAISLLYRAMRSKGNTHFAFAIGETALRENPMHPLRFNLGLDYSRSNLDDLALLHFSFLHDRGEKDAGTLHNLALACSEAGLPIASVRHYKEAIEAGGTLAASNLAYKYLDAGMAEEAKTFVEAAMRVDGHDTRVEGCLGDIAKRSRNESEKQTQVLTVATKRATFLAEMGKALDREPPLLDGNWKFPFGEIAISTSSNVVSGSAEITTEQSGFGILLEHQVKKAQRRRGTR